jgi:MFS transporter, OFA family, oxalate/formate antiporter
MKRYVILSAAFLMQMCLGATYSWSVFVRPIRELTDLSQGIAQVPFTTFYFAFPVTLLFSGRILSFLGPRRSAMIGTLLFGCGWSVAGLGGPYSFALVVLGIGMVAGMGVGFAYIVPIAVGNRWFPERPGLVTGIAVAGFAIGAALVSTGAEAIMYGWGLTPFQAFALLGLGFLVLGVPAAARMAFPGGTDVAPEASPRWRDLFRTPEFLQLFPAMVAGLAAGFAVNSNLKDLSPASGVAAGATAVSAFAIANAVGRVAWGWIFDRMVPSSALRLNLIAQAITLAGVFLFVRDLPSLLAFAALTGFNYGGVLVLYASTVARRWGLQHVGQVYGLLFAANIVASPAPMLAGFSLDVLGSFTPAFLLFGAVAALTALRVGRTVDQRPGKGQVQTG